MLLLFLLLLFRVLLLTPEEADFASPTEAQLQQRRRVLMQTRNIGPMARSEKLLRSCG